MTPVARSASALAAVALALSLAGCGGGGDSGKNAPADAAEAQTTQVADASGEQEDDGGTQDASGGACPTVPQGGYELYGSDLVTVAPADGAVYGDGTPISWTLAAPPDGTLDVDMSYVNEAGDAIPMGGIFLEDFGGNEWGSTLNVFTSDADGRPGFMFLGLTNDANVSADGATGHHEVLGVYCVTFKVAP